MMEDTETHLKLEEVDFSMKAPCSDCPFKRTSPIHSGVAKDLINIHGKIEMGRFAHTCHKTDKRSDGYDPNYKGGVKHCAGALVMMKNMGPEAIQDFWLSSGNWKHIKRLKIHPDVFKDIADMVFHYAKELKDDGYLLRL